MVPLLITDLTIPRACFFLSLPSLLSHLYILSLTLNHSLLFANYFFDRPLVSIFRNHLLKVESNQPIRSYFVTLASSSFLQKGTILDVSKKDTPNAPSSTYFKMLHFFFFFQIYPRTKNYASACLNTLSPSGSIMQGKSGRKPCNCYTLGPAWG